MNRREEIRRRLNAATLGPWKAHDFGYPGEQEPSSIVIHTGEFNWRDIQDGDFIVTTPLWDRQEDDDAQFIANSREDVEYLLDELDSKDVEIARLKEDIAERIFLDEQKCRGAIVKKPTDAFLNGRLLGLQRARDIVTHEI
jgi:hypothetical protein